MELSQYARIALVISVILFDCDFEFLARFELEVLDDCFFGVVHCCSGDVDCWDGVSEEWFAV